MSINEEEYPNNYLGVDTVTGTHIGPSNRLQRGARCFVAIRLGRPDLRRRGRRHLLPYRHSFDVEPARLHLHGRWHRRRCDLGRHSLDGSDRRTGRGDRHRRCSRRR